MAVTVDAVSTVAAINAAVTGTTATGTITINAAATLVVVFIELGQPGAGSDVNITGTGTFTIGGNALTHLGSALKHSGSDADHFGYTDIYYLTSPPTGAGLTLSWAPTCSSNTNTGSATAVSYLGALNASPLGTPQLANGQLVSSLTVSDTLASGDLLVGICGNGTSVPGITTGTSDLSNAGGATTGCHQMRIGHNSGTGSVSLAFSTDNTDYSCLSAVKIVAAGGGGGSDPVPTRFPLAPRARYRAASW